MLSGALLLFFKNVRSMRRSRSFYILVYYVQLLPDTSRSVCAHKYKKPGCRKSTARAYISNLRKVKVEGGVPRH